MRFYKGKNVEGFMIWEMLNGFRYLYKTDRDECGPCLYWRVSIASPRVANRRWQKSLREYPSFVNFINSLKVNSFKDNPPCVFEPVRCYYKRKPSISVVLWLTGSLSLARNSGHNLG